MTKPQRVVALAGTLLLLSLVAAAQEPGKQPSSYAPVDIRESFATTMARMKAAKPEVEKRQADLLATRYDLANRPAKGVTMSRGKP
ncbi:MAG: cytochrome B6, partial [Candidatus Binatia bacterium]